MPQLIRPQEVKVITKDGEIQVSLVIDLNINLSGGVEIASITAQEKKDVKSPQKSEDTHWAIPDFGPAPKIQFGKKE